MAPDGKTGSFTLKKPIKPNNMQLVPYLIFNGNCEEALNFYKKALGGSIGQISRYADAPENQMGMDPQKIMHTHFAVDGNIMFMASDGPSDANDSGMVSLSLNMNDIGHTQNIFNSLTEGGMVTMPLQETFWGATFGMLKDRYGIKWMLNCEKK
jgi:PhnB protein